MRRQRGIGRTEVLIGVAVAVVLALIAVPLLLGVGRKSAREEVPLDVNAIREYEFAYQEPFGEYVSADPAPRLPQEVTSKPVPWHSNAGFDKIGWAPEDPSAVYGSYKVAATDKGFTVYGTCDVDGDGERATYSATEKDEAKATTAAGIY